jgi:hypothetical protein
MFSVMPENLQNVSHGRNDTYNTFLSGNILIKMWLLSLQTIIVNLLNSIMSHIHVWLLYST